MQNPKLLPLQGKTLAQIAKDRGKDPIETLMDILVEDDAFTENAVFGMSEPDVTLALQQPWTSVDNDSQGTAPDGLLGKEHPHPRAYGTFPRILRKYVREEHKLTLEDAIRKFTALPAQRMRFTDRGVLKQGMWADVVVFDPDSIRDVATFEQPNQLVGRDEVRAGERRAGDRGREDDGRAAGEGACGGRGIELEGTRRATAVRLRLSNLEWKLAISRFAPRWRIFPTCNFARLRVLAAFIVTGVAHAQAPAAGPLVLLLPASTQRAGTRERFDPRRLFDLLRSGTHRRDERDRSVVRTRYAVERHLRRVRLRA